MIKLENTLKWQATHGVPPGKGIFFKQMSKLHAHLFLLVLDIAALIAAFYTMTTWSDLLNQVINAQPEVSFQSGYTFVLVLLVVPVIHVWAIYEGTKSPSEKIKKWANRLLIVFTLFLAVSAILMNIKLTQSLTKYHYFYCEQLSDSMTFSEFRVYLKDSKLCVKSY
ncbi:hypothetical protein [Hahella ganghwensis]|uniref:hypothetical protein n=1 Tax=Hahella ganghwensis TaxID=286420 RepID=UPI00037BD9CA|nr:hypothetical protein [Hahella ganghwensis]